MFGHQVCACAYSRKGLHIPEDACKKRSAALEGIETAEDGLFLLQCGRGMESIERIKVNSRRHHETSASVFQVISER